MGLFELVERVAIHFVSVERVVWASVLAECALGKVVDTDLDEVVGMDLGGVGDTGDVEAFDIAHAAVLEIE